MAPVAALIDPASPIVIPMAAVDPPTIMIVPPVEAVAVNPPIAIVEPTAIAPPHLQILSDCCQMPALYNQCFSMRNYNLLYS